jgi:DNA-binding MarR family transcriptional regulator
MRTNEIVEKFLTLKKTMGAILRKVELGEGIGITEMSILIKLADEKNVTLSKLSEITGYSNSLITFAVDSLEKKGLVKRIKGIDRRIFYVELTDEGKEKCIEMRKKINEKLMDLLSSLTNDEIKELLDCMERVIEELKRAELKSKNKLQGKDS